MANLNFVHAGEMVEYLSNKQFKVNGYRYLETTVVPTKAQLSPALYWSGKRVLDEIELMDKWIRELAEHRQALIGLLNEEEVDG